VSWLAWRRNCSFDGCHCLLVCQSPCVFVRTFDSRCGLTDQLNASNMMLMMTAWQPNCGWWNCRLRNSHPDPNSNRPLSSKDDTKPLDVVAHTIKNESDLIDWKFLSASLYVSKRGAYWDRLCRDVVGRWLVVTRVHCGQTVHPRPIVTMEH